MSKVQCVRVQCVKVQCVKVQCVKVHIVKILDPVFTYYCNFITLLFM
jgi:hypothetical protein